MLSALEAAGGVLAIAVGGYFLVAVNVIASSVGLGPVNIPDFYVFFSGEILLGVLGPITAYGLWKGRRWGWSLAVYAGISTLVYSIGFGAYFLATYGDFTETQATIVPMLVSLGAVYYLDKAEAKAFFGRK